MAESTFRTTFPPEGTSPTVSRPRALVSMADMGRERIGEIDGELADLETTVRRLLVERATIEATIRIAAAASTTQGKGGRHHRMTNNLVIGLGALALALAVQGLFYARRARQLRMREQSWGVMDTRARLMQVLGRVGWNAKLEVVVGALRAEVARLTPPPGCRWVAVSEELMAQMGEWSDPVRVKIEAVDERQVTLAVSRYAPATDTQGVGGEVTRYLTTRAEVEALCKAAHAEGARQERERERENTIAIEGAGIRWDEVDADMKYEGRCVAVKIERGKVEHAAALARVRAEAVLARHRAANEDGLYRPTGAEGGTDG